MKKDKLTLDAIKEDLLKMAESKILNKTEGRFLYIVPITLLAILLGILLENIFVGLLVFSPAVYHIVRYIIEYREYRQSKRAVLALIARGEISISKDALSHIAEETIYEPNYRYTLYSRRTRALKTVTVFHFKGCASWRIPEVYGHYTWSREFHISSYGLENTSLIGDEFYFVSLQANHEIAYIYPCKFFELDASLKNDVI